MDEGETKEKPATPISPAEAPDLGAMSDDQLLAMRICDLKLRIPGSELESRIETFYAELAGKNILVKPVCYLGEEWFCPEGCATIAIPFYLAHPRLKKLEEKMMLEVEGGTEAWCLRLLRHEMGHVLNHAYLLEKDKSWQKLFGPVSLEYSESFRARPYSRGFVRHLDGYYAQSHPEEDFAETVAIWLTPHLDWRRQYRGSAPPTSPNSAKRPVLFASAPQASARPPPMTSSNSKPAASEKLRLGGSREQITPQRSRAAQAAAAGCGFPGQFLPSGWQKQVVVDFHYAGNR